MLSLKVLTCFNISISLFDFQQLIRRHLFYVAVPPEIPDVYANEKKIPSNVINVSVIENNTLALRCETFSKPRPEYQWIEHGKLHTNSNTLLIAAPKRNDDLLVECQVSNFMQRDPGRSEQVNRSRNIQLDILCKIDIYFITQFKRIC